MATFSRLPALALGVSLLALVGACDEGTGLLSGAPCDPAGQCPAGLVCVNSVCVAPAAGDATDVVPTDTPASPDGSCTPSCTGRECGSNGCGGLCGTCGAGTFCNAQFQCEAGSCTPSCTGRECGDNGCGGLCGTCGAGTFCNAQFQCEAGSCTPSCTGRECGANGCGGQCGACEAGETCNAAGLCEPGGCVPDCTGRQCGANGCGGLCGSCAAGQTCSAGQCVAGNCGEGTLDIRGALQTPETAVTFDHVTASVNHKRDVDAWEDRCIVAVTLDFGLGDGCTLRVEAGAPVTPGGAWTVQSLVFTADSQCPGFSDEREGVYTDVSDLTTAEVYSETTEVPDPNAAESCLTTTFELRLEGVLHDPQSDRDLTIEQTAIEVSGEFLSVAQSGTTCPCRPACSGRECGDDGCGGSCGNCPSGTRCVVESGQCECVPNCAGRECGDNGCGGSCGSCEGSDVCDDGDCRPCEPNCAGRECGDNGCGGSCGSCVAGETCTNYACVCQPNCTGRECGSNGCGGSCGNCSLFESCVNGRCSSCEPNCTGRECGDDGCGGSCGNCPASDVCTALGQCAPPGGTCQASRTLTCGASVSGTNQGGSDSIDSYSCGSPPWNENGPEIAYRFTATEDGTLTATIVEQGVDLDVFILADQCSSNACIAFENLAAVAPVEAGNTYYVVVDGYNGAVGNFNLSIACEGPCEPECAGRQCGDDGCGGTCGTCAAGRVCQNGQCVVCTPNCGGRICGDDGCGGSCGPCPEGTLCNAEGTACDDSCGGIPAHGCCAEGMLGPSAYMCGVPMGLPCALFGDGTCGWDPSTESYNCGFTGEDPSGEYPIECPPDMPTGGGLPGA